MPEKIMVEWEVTLHCNYNCFYCTNLDPTIKPVTDHGKLALFIEQLGNEYPGVEIFIFGGEPFLHPEISFIIETFNRFNIPFVIQTNLSKKSLQVINKLKEPVILQVSIHPTEIPLSDINIPDNINIRTIDVMFTGLNAVPYYLSVKGKAEKVYLTPIGDFGDGISGATLDKYNEMRNDPRWENIIDFEEVKRLGDYRSNMWTDYSPRGKPCLYQDIYFLYSPNLDLYNCCHRVNHTGICNHDKCFLM